MPMIRVREVDYHYEISGTGKPLLMLHGFTGCTDNWVQVARALVSQYQVIAVDLLGHGQTSKPEDADRYRIEYAAGDLITLIEKVLVQPLDLLGYSMGGRLALYLALHYPQYFSSLILESASPGLATIEERAARRESDHQLADRIVGEGIEAFVDYWESIPLFATQAQLSPEKRAWLREQRLQNDPKGLANSLRGMGTGVQPSLWDQLAYCAVPTQLIAGALDSKFLDIARQIDRRLPKSTVHIVANAGHTVHLEQPARFADILLATSPLER